MTSRKKRPLAIPYRRTHMHHASLEAMDRTDASRVRKMQIRITVSGVLKGNAVMVTTRSRAIRAETMATRIRVMAIDHNGKVVPQIELERIAR